MHRKLLKIISTGRTNSSAIKVVSQNLRGNVASGSAVLLSHYLSPTKWSTTLATAVSINCSLILKETNKLYERNLVTRSCDVLFCDALEKNQVYTTKSPFSTCLKRRQLIRLFVDMLSLRYCEKMSTVSVSQPATLKQNLYCCFCIHVTSLLKANPWRVGKQIKLAGKPRSNLMCPAGHIITIPCSMGQKGKCVHINFLFVSWCGFQNTYPGLGAQFIKKSCKNTHCSTEHHWLRCELQFEASDSKQSHDLSRFESRLLLCVLAYFFLVSHNKTYFSQWFIVKSKITL